MLSLFSVALAGELGPKSTMLWTLGSISELEISKSILVERNVKRLTLQIHAVPEK